MFTRQGDGSEGTPAAFDQQSFALLRTLDGERGARSLRIPGASVIVPENATTLRDIDRPADIPSA